MIIICRGYKSSMHPLLKWSGDTTVVKAKSMLKLWHIIGMPCTGSQTSDIQRPRSGMIQEEVWYMEEKRKRLRALELASKRACGESDTIASSGKGKDVVPPGCPDHPKAICGSMVWGGEDHPDQPYGLMGGRWGLPLKESTKYPRDFCNNVGRKDGWSQLRLVVEDSLPSQYGECLHLFEW